ncbi:hypothetical protein FGG78_27985 [Thioclava sp. BHET1]|nr:hypothetical protein FGG78_27985 [Thioclava sp. BHET1]
MPYTDLTPDQLSALRDFARKNGRQWKSRLQERWMTASAEPTLHQLRNTHGPSWLRGYRLDLGSGDE